MEGYTNIKEDLNLNEWVTLTLLYSYYTTPGLLNTTDSLVL